MNARTTRTANDRWFTKDDPGVWGGQRYLIVVGLIFLLAVGLRLMSAQDARSSGQMAHAAVTADYQKAGQLYRTHIRSFFSRGSPLNNPDLLSHPPGYSLLWAGVFEIRGYFGDSGLDPRVIVQLLQILVDAAAAVCVFLIAGQLLPRPVGLIVGFMVALAPQFTWNSVMLQPDTLVVLPILLSIYCLIDATKHSDAGSAMLGGALIGLSCWFRSNGLLLAPFVCLFLPALVARGKRLPFAAAILSGAILVIAPLTIRNALVFGKFVPLSLGAGQTMLEGIGDYDPEKRFGIPNTDIEIMREEAQTFGRPQYAETLFGADGIERERRRLLRASDVIGAHPFWFTGVMLRRAVSMLRLERTPRITGEPPVMDSLSPPEKWTRIPRTFFGALQKAFITAIALPLTLIGLVVIVRGRCWRTMTVLLLVPAYYLCVQSALHTEYRYVLAIHYCLFIIAAAGIWFLGSQTWRLLRRDQGNSVEEVI